MIQFIIYGILSGMAYTLVGGGFLLIFRLTRFFHFTHAALYTMGAYLAYLFWAQLGFSQVFAFPLSCVLVAVAAVGIELGIYRPMRRDSATDLTLLVASLGLYVILQNVISAAWGDDIKTMRTGGVMEGYELLGARITAVQIMIIAASVILIAMIGVALTRTKYGKTFRALADDPELSRLSGITADRYIMCTFALGSFLAAVASIIISYDTDMVPTMGFNILVKGVIAVIIGGIGNLRGAALGGVFLGLAENIAVYWLPSKWQDTIAFSILILFLLIRPYGILGSRPEEARV
jgi:branched-subunit amino acid ABC-type transport system permease component